MIRFTKVSKHYARGAVAVRDVTLRIHRGEFVFLTGHSGSGKSTLLKMIYMDERPTSGQVVVSGVNSSDARQKEIVKLRRKLGIVFQDFRLLEDRTAEQNVAFALEVTGTPRSQIPARVSRVLARVGLASNVRALPRELSGGEQQRVAIARALVNDPFVLLADEPTGNLDDRATRGIFQLLREINAAGTAVVMATHNVELMRRSELRTIELDQGRVVFDSALAAARPVAELGDPTSPVAEGSR